MEWITKFVSNICATFSAHDHPTTLTKYSTCSAIKTTSLYVSALQPIYLNALLQLGSLVFDVIYNFIPYVDMTDIAGGFEQLKQNLHTYQLSEEDFKQKLQQINSTRAKINSELITLTQQYDRKLKDMQSRLDAANSRNDRLAKDNQLYRREIQSFESRLLEKERLIASLLAQQSERATSSELVSRSIRRDQEGRGTFKKNPETQILPKNINDQHQTERHATQVARQEKTIVQAEPTVVKEDKSLNQQSQQRQLADKTESVNKSARQEESSPTEVKKRVPPPPPPKRGTNTKSALPAQPKRPKQSEQVIAKQQAPVFTHSKKEEKAVENIQQKVFKRQPSEQIEDREQPAEKQSQDKANDNTENFFDNLGAEEEDMELPREEEVPVEINQDQQEDNHQEELQPSYNYQQNAFDEQPENSQNFFQHLDSQPNDQEQQVQEQKQPIKPPAKQKKQQSSANPYFMDTPASEDFFASLDQQHENPMGEVQQSSIDYTETHSVISNSATKMFDPSEHMRVVPPAKKMQKKKGRREIKSIDSSAF